MMSSKIGLSFHETVPLTSKTFKHFFESVYIVPLRVSFLEMLKYVSKYLYKNFVKMDVCMDVCMNACMYVCINACMGAL